MGTFICTSRCFTELHLGKLLVLWQHTKILIATFKIHRLQFYYQCLYSSSSSHESFLQSFCGSVVEIFRNHCTKAFITLEKYHQMTNTHTKEVSELSHSTNTFKNEKLSLNSDLFFYLFFGRYSTHWHCTGQTKRVQIGQSSRHYAGAAKGEGGFHTACPTERAAVQHLQQHYNNR